MLTDYHMHLQPDGVAERAAASGAWDEHGGHLSLGWLERYLEQARARAVAEIAITEHVYRFAASRSWLDHAFWQAEATEDIGAYCAAIGAAQAAGRPVLLGIEMDWLPDRRTEIAAFLDARPFDIVLGSVHWLDGVHGVDDPGAPAADVIGAEEVWTRYWRAWIEAVDSGLYDVMSHPDLPKVFGSRMPASLNGAVDAALETAVRSGIAIECSSAGLRKRVRELYPDPDLLARFRAAGVPVTLSSDAHAPGDVGRDYPTAVAALRGAGYTTITRFRRREPEQVSLRWT